MVKEFCIIFLIHFGIKREGGARFRAEVVVAFAPKWPIEDELSPVILILKNLLGVRYSFGGE